jgi:Na+/citrate or Na+/malate symporter
MEKTKYKVTAWIIGLLGVWLILACFIVKAANANCFDDLIVGLAIVFFGMLLSRVREVRSWWSYLFGAWMIIAAFIPALLVGTGHV